MDEQVILEQDKIHCWRGPKRKATLFSAKLGRVVLTNERLIFLSTGKHGVTAGRLVAGGLGIHAFAQTTKSTRHLEFDALDNDGSWSMPLGTLTAAELGRGKVLVVTFASNSGSESHTFAPKNLGMPNGTGWVTAIEQARAAAGSDPAPSAAEPPPEPAPGTDPDAPTSTIPEPPRPAEPTAGPFTVPPPPSS